MDIAVDTLSLMISISEWTRSLAILRDISDPHDLIDGLNDVINFSEIVEDMEDEHHPLFEYLSLCDNTQRLNVFRKIEGSKLTGLHPPLYIKLIDMVDKSLREHLMIKDNSAQTILEHIMNGEFEKIDLSN